MTTNQTIDGIRVYCRDCNNFGTPGIKEINYTHVVCGDCAQRIKVSREHDLWAGIFMRAHPEDIPDNGATGRKVEPLNIQIKIGDEMKNIDDVEGNEFNTYYMPVKEFSFDGATFDTHFAADVWLEHRSGKLEDVDKNVQESSAKLKSTLHFSLQGEHFYINACELRDLLRQRNAANKAESAEMSHEDRITRHHRAGAEINTSDHCEMKAPEYSRDLGSMVERINRHHFADGRINTSDPCPQLRYAVNGRLSERETVNADNVVSVGISRWTSLYESQSGLVYQLSSAYVNPPQWTDQDKESYDAHVGKDGWITRILYKN